jgi:hypothetical protein
MFTGKLGACAILASRPIRIASPRLCNTASEGSPRGASVPATKAVSTRVITAAHRVPPRDALVRIARTGNSVRHYAYQPLLGLITDSISE